MAEITVVAELTSAVWKIEAGPGTSVSAGDTIVILESMKMEIPVLAPSDGTVTAILVAEGDQITEGQAVAKLEA
ncbi:biotin/lipoyl-binding carrier protein [Roseococcus thiosulfatophilus]|uniref:biotin/lipoyl-binding carrier protein n=1 Tax=Roseococcus thiosulfatophilus TaxID=35813 RepID=UPI001A8D9226|nr:biotin/lipoyl-binding carrier protein [Roseococcus thiosulfatophilus]